MIRKIILENYMSHVRTVIEPAEGLTVLIGPNNCGKSAVIHALEMICYNSEAADFAIRHGTKKATVTVETQDADGARHTLVWWRKKETAGYSIDGREVSGIGRSKTPDDLHTHLRMPRTEAAGGKEAFFLHFGLQKSPIFLLDDPAGRAAEFFASSSDADKLLEMQKRHGQKTANAKRDKDKLDAEIQQFDGQLQVLSPLAEISARLAELERECAQVTDLAREIDDRRELAGQLEQAAGRASVGALRVGAMGRLRPPPGYHDLAAIGGLVDAMAGQKLRADQSGALGNVLSRLNPSPALAETAGLSLLCRKLEEVARQSCCEEGRVRATAVLRPAPSRHDTQPLQGMVDALGESQRHHHGAETRRAALGDLAMAPPQADVISLATLLGQLEELAGQSRIRQFQTMAMESLSEPPALPDLAELRARIGVIAQAIAARDLARARQSAVSNLCIAPGQVDCSPVRDAINAFEEAQRRETLARDATKVAVDAVAAQRSKIEQWVLENPRCGACGQAITPELIFSGGHGHE